MAKDMPWVNVLVEGVTDEAVVRRLLEHTGLHCGYVYGKNGKGALLKLLPNYNRAAHFTSWLTVVDLDQDAECAPPFVQRVLAVPSQYMVFRVAVQAVEAWLLADAERIAAFLGIPKARIPPSPDTVPDPKALLIDLARQSRRKAIREDIVPREGSGSRVGPGYVGRLIEFVTATEHLWRPNIASEHSDSLRRCIESLQAIPQKSPC
jgi:hypothetical protein